MKCLRDELQQRRWYENLENKLQLEIHLCIAVFLLFYVLLKNADVAVKKLSKKSWLKYSGQFFAVDSFSMF